MYKEVASNVAFIIDGPTCSDTEIDYNIGKLNYCTSKRAIDKGAAHSAVMCLCFSRFLIYLSIYLSMGDRG